MKGAWSEQQPILAGFADEIQPLLAVVAGAIDRLVERPDDVTAATIGLAELQTLQGAVSMLDVPGFVALLGMAHDAIETLVGLQGLSRQKQAAVRELGELLLHEGAALGKEEPSDLPPPRAAELLASLRAAPGVQQAELVTLVPESLDAWLDTLAPGEEPAPAASAPAAPSEAAAELAAASTAAEPAPGMARDEDTTGELLPAVPSEPWGAMDGIEPPSEAAPVGPVHDETIRLLDTLEGFPTDREEAAASPTVDAAPAGAAAEREAPEVPERPEVIQEPLAAWEQRILDAAAALPPVPAAEPPSAAASEPAASAAPVSGDDTMDLTPRASAEDASPTAPEEAMADGSLEELLAALEEVTGGELSTDERAEAAQLLEQAQQPAEPPPSSAVVPTGPPNGVSPEAPTRQTRREDIWRALQDDQALPSGGVPAPSEPAAEVDFEDLLATLEPVSVDAEADAGLTASAPVEAGVEPEAAPEAVEEPLAAWEQPALEAAAALPLPPVEVESEAPATPAAEEVAASGPPTPAEAVADAGLASSEEAVTGELLPAAELAGEPATEPPSVAPITDEDTITEETLPRDAVRTYLGQGMAPVDAETPTSTDAAEPVAQLPPAAAVEDAGLAELLATLEDVTGESLPTAERAEAGPPAEPTMALPSAPPVVDPDATTEETFPPEAAAASAPSDAAAPEAAEPLADWEQRALEAAAALPVLPASPDTELPAAAAAEESVASLAPEAGAQAPAGVPGAVESADAVPPVPLEPAGDADLAALLAALEDVTGEPISAAELTEAGLAEPAAAPSDAASVADQDVITEETLPRDAARAVLSQDAPPADADAAATIDTTEPAAQPAAAAEMAALSMEASALPADTPAADTSEGTLAELLAALEDVTGERLSMADRVEAGLPVDPDAITDEASPRDALAAHEPAATAPVDEAPVGEPTAASSDVDTGRVDAETDVGAAAGVPAEVAPEAVEEPLADWEQRALEAAAAQPLLPVAESPEGQPPAAFEPAAHVPSQTPDAEALPAVDLESLLDTLDEGAEAVTAADEAGLPASALAAEALPAAPEDERPAETVGEATAPLEAAAPAEALADFAPEDARAAEEVPAEAEYAVEPAAEARVPAEAPASAAEAEREPAHLIPAGAGNPEALAVFASEQVRLAEALAQARAALEAAPDDEGALTDLVWATHTLRGAATLVGAQAIGEVCSLIERAAEHLQSQGPPVPAAALAFLATAEAVLQELVAVPPAGTDTTAGVAEMVTLLAVQLDELERGGAGGAAPSPAAAAGWGDLPPELAARLEGVDVADLDEATLGELAELLAAHDAAATAGAVPEVGAVAAAGEEAEAPGGEAAGEGEPAPAAADRGEVEPATAAAEAGEAARAELPPLADEATAAQWSLPTEVGATAPGAAAVPLDADAEFEAELRVVFLGEVEEHLATINGALLALESSSGDTARLVEVRRAVHTLKSASASVGLPVVADFCHVWEDALEAVEEGRASAPELSLLLECAEALEHYFHHSEAGETAAAAATFEPLVGRLRATAGLPPEAAPRVSLAPGRAADGQARTAPAAELESALETEVADEEAADEGAPPAGAEPTAAGTTPVAGARAENLRVPLERVDALVGLVGELVVQRSGVLQRLERLGIGLDDLGPSLARLRRMSMDLEDRFAGAGEVWSTARYRRGGLTGSAAEFDELEFDRYGEAYLLARELSELAADLATTRRDLGHLLEDAQLAVERQGRIAGDLHDELLDVRLVPLSQIALRLQRTVRQAALQSGKAVGFALEGGETLLDKTLLDQLADPLLHLLRNAVDHGIEPAEERTRRGKPTTGTVRVTAAREGNEIVVQVSDDGAGIDTTQVLARARARGLAPADAPDDPHLAHELIFAPGLSTSTTVTGLSGRGIGLDAVRAHLARAKGTVTVTSALGQGTTFTLRLPSLLVVAPALVVVAGGQRLALPLAQVRRVLRVAPDAVVHVGETQMLPLDGENLRLRRLGTLLGWPAPPDAEAPTTLLVVVVAVGERQVALLVEDILGQQEVVVKTPAPPFDVLPGLAGASIQGNGEVLLVLNLLELVIEPGGGRPRGIPAPPQSSLMSALAPPTVLVVDDSLSVRRVVVRALERHGWRVAEARDGVQALEVLRETAPDALLLDIEMPRMDGYELASIMKKQELYQDIPIVMLTSRGGEKHRRKAFELGVNAYLVKPYQEAELVRVLSEVALAVPPGAA